MQEFDLPRITRRAKIPFVIDYKGDARRVRQPCQ